MLRSTITAVAVLDTAPDRDRLRDLVDRGTRLVPRMRQRVRGEPALDRAAPLGGRPQLRPRLPPALRAGRRRPQRPVGARPGRADRHAGLRPGPAAVGDHGGRGAGGRPGRPDPQGPPRHHRRRGRGADRPRDVRARAGDRRARRHARRPRGRGDGPGRAVLGRHRPRAPAQPRHREALGRHRRRRSAIGARRPGRDGRAGRRDRRVRGPHGRTGDRTALTADDRAVALGPLRHADASGCPRRRPRPSGWAAPSTTRSWPRPRGGFRRYHDGHGGTTPTGCA